MFHLRIVRAQGVTLNGHNFNHPELARRQGEIVTCNDMDEPEAAELLVVFTDGGHVVAERPGVASVKPWVASRFERRLARHLQTLAAMRTGQAHQAQQSHPNPGAPL